MKNLTKLAGVSLLVIASSAFAEQSLTETQMDQVSAGGATAYGAAIGTFLGDNFSSTISTSNALALPAGAGWAVGSASNTTIATSLLGFAGASSTSEAVAGIW
ncbi:MAG: hypothetical protein K9L22_13200 [Methylococcaceae bacterium]|nr:hypothetical protein [Methylococcaceae bacterium]